MPLTAGRRTGRVSLFLEADMVDHHSSVVAQRNGPRFYGGSHNTQRTNTGRGRIPNIMAAIYNAGGMYGRWSIKSADAPHSLTMAAKHGLYYDSSRDNFLSAISATES